MSNTGLYTMKVSKQKLNASPENILYELMLYTEWNQESDNVRLSNKNEVFSTGYRIWRPWDYLKKCDSLFEAVSNVQNSLLGWHFAVGEVGTVLAILQETLLEIRTPRDDFSSVVGKATVLRDSYQQWRRLCWSPDSSILAVATSNGAINFYDLLGSNLFNIPAVGNGKENPVCLHQHSLAGIFFIKARGKNQKWPFELIVVDYEGNLRSYYISQSEGFMEFHTFSLNKGGVSSLCWDTTHNLIIIASPTEHKHIDLKGEHVGWGLSAWRLLNDAPYYRLAVPSPEDLAHLEARKGLVSWFTSFYTSFPFSVVFKMAVSPTGQHLACVHTCSTVSIWLLPSLRLHGIWNLKEQPNFNIQAENMKKKTRGLQLDDFAPVDVSWWADQKVMIARRNGAVSVCELSELRNLLGETPEFVHGEPKLSPVSTNKGILVLECETNQSQDGNSSGDEEESLVTRSSALVQSTVYLLTDMERFQPRRKKAKVQKRIYRLLGIKSTTPDELFSRKIDAGEFEEALHLAEMYNLDSDRVYQSQWRNSPISEDTISAYLSKISKKRWVFEECHERIPDTLQAAKKLIEFGLKITSLSALSDLCRNQTEVLASENEENEWSEKDLLLIPLHQLTDDQKCLIMTRRTLLHFSDKLFTYEKIIGSEEEAYDRDVYDKFRRQPVCLSAIELAQESDHRAVSHLLTYQGPGTLPYWLTILSNFPETTHPDAYKDLLPECSSEGDVFLWEQAEIRTEDWCENHIFNELEPFEDLSEFQVCEKDKNLIADVLEEWYRNRIYEIELRSNMVDQPLELVKLARERNIKGLDGLYNELITLEVLVYDVGMEEIRLRDLEIMTPIEKAEALMNQSTEETFVENMRHRLLPFMQRCEKFQSLSREDLLSQYVTEISKKDLRCTIKVLEYCVAEPQNALVQSPEKLITLALDSVYAYPGTDQLTNTDAILRILPINQLPTSNASLLERVKGAQNELTVATILKARGHPLSPLHIHNHCTDLTTARTLFSELANAIGARVPPATDADWTELLQDLLQIQSSVFTCMPLDLCYEVHTVGVLASGSVPVVRTAVRSLCCHSEERGRKPLTLERSVALVLHAATQYFDSAASLADPNIGLAKACLSLITEDNIEIQEEKDLIAAYQLLNDFKISLLPMQVRLCTERMKLVESCLMCRPTAYKEYYKLLSLANKLRICGSDSRQREGIILLRVANISFEAHDYQFCAEMCQQLIDRRHAVGWQAAQRLGQCGQFLDIETRQRLIAFAIIHCPDDKILELMDTRCELEHKQLQTLIKEQTNMADTPSDDEEFIDAVTSPQSPTKEFLPQQLISSTIQNTSKLLTHLTNTGFWKEKLLKKESVIDKKEKGDKRMNLQGFPVYYSSVHSDRPFHKSVLSVEYSGETVDWKQYQLIYALLRASLLEQEKLPQQLLQDIDNVLVQFATLVLPEDSCVGLAALLAVSRPETHDRCFSSLPHTRLTLQLAVYVLALMPALQYDPEAFLWTPNQVVGWAEAHTDSMGETSQLLMKSLTQLRNFEQSKQVEQLDCGVNVRRFAWDHQYKTDSILGLAMCEEWFKLQSALELGSAHGVEGWEIVLSHVRNLLTTNSPLLAERLADNRLTQTLRDQADDVVKRLQEVVLPTLNGVHYNQLISYYTVLQTVAPNIVICSLLPRDHIKLIKKVKATSADIDYLRLVSKPAEVMEVLRPALKEDSVNGVARLLKELLKTLPQLQDFITVSSLYAEWAVIQFKTECLNPNCRDRLEQFSALQTYFQKMNMSDLLSFVRRAIFCHLSVIKLHVETRQAMIEVCLKSCTQHHLNEDPDVLKIQRLKEYIHDVWSLENPSLKSLQNYIIRLDEACGDSDAISTIIQTALVDGSVPLHVIQSMAKLSSKKSITSYVTDLLHSLPPNQLLLTIVLQRVEDCLAQGEKADSWSILIGPISDKPDLPAAVRKQAAQISQRLGASHNEELEALRLRSEAVLRSPVQLAQVCDQNARYLLFKQRLTQADSWDNLHTLSLLLSTWPDVDTSWYLELIETMSDFPNDEAFSTLENLFKKNTFEDEEIEHLVARLEGNYMFTIMVCLIPNIRRLHAHAVKMLRNLPSETALPKEVAKRVVEAELTAELTGSPILTSLRECLLDLGPEFCEQASRQLVSKRQRSSVLGHD